MTKQNEYTLTEAAKYLNVSRSTVRRYLDAGEFKNARKTWRGIALRVWVIPQADLDRIKKH